jgi:hypothetical protein
MNWGIKAEFSTSAKRVRGSGNVHFERWKAHTTGFKPLNWGYERFQTVQVHEKRGWRDWDGVSKLKFATGVSDEKRGSLRIRYA